MIYNCLRPIFYQNANPVASGLALWYTVNVENFAQYIFSRISRRALDARKFDVSENYTHDSTNRNKSHLRENLTVRICIIGLDA